MLSVELIENVGNTVVFWISRLRFEGKILAVDDNFLKYYDTHKNRERFVKISEIENMEIND